MDLPFTAVALAAASSLEADTVAIESMKLIATVLFGLAVLHTFAVKRLLHWAGRFEEGSIGENLFHFLGEVEVVFGVWAAILIAIWSLRFGTNSAASYLDQINFTEAAFVFVIMCMAATKPVMTFADRSIFFAAKHLPGPRHLVKYWVTLIIGPLLGSLITEPAAMTVTALLLKRDYFDQASSQHFKYASLGLLFVNISIGGTLTHFAAPPVLMVAGPWSWDTAFMFSNFGWRVMIAVTVGTIATSLLFSKELKRINGIRPAPSAAKGESSKRGMPWWIIASHLVFMLGVIMHAHYMSFFLPLFLFFIGWCTVTKEYQDELRVRESLLVGFFLGGLVTLGGLQDWWLKPLLSQLGETPLFWGALSLTAVTDNAAITYLGTMVPNLSDAAKYALVAGAVAGGGLTVIANAPNPAGYGILNESFGEEGINPVGLLLGALPYTLLAAVLLLI